MIVLVLPIVEAHMATYGTLFWGYCSVLVSHFGQSLALLGTSFPFATFQFVRQKKSVGVEVTKFGECRSSGI